MSVEMLWGSTFLIAILTALIFGVNLFVQSWVLFTLMLASGFITALFLVVASVTHFTAILIRGKKPKTKRSGW